MHPNAPPAPRRRARAVLPAVLALTGSAALLFPTETQAFTTLGSWLPMQSHRDVRVCPNFTDPTVLDNTTPDPNFPGYVGVELAIWKACVEWSSQPHGDGSGDPHQPGGLGSGGANFDIAWLGRASSPGAFDNTHSQLNGDGSGVYAYTQFNGVGNGWVIRYYSDPWVWEDGPGDLPGGRTDIQGIATHEYGHALGLGHSNAGGATMLASTSESNSINLRSINSDDIAGVRSIYGVAASDKPTIASITQTMPGLLEIAGANFDATSNEVWFSRSGPSTPAQGVPIKAFGVPSSAGGTLISVAIPVGAGSGAVLVRRPGDGGDDLSNAWPFDVAGAGLVQTFCNDSDNAIFWCPCGNSGDSDTGCDNSAGTGGVKMALSSFDPDGPTAVVTCTGYPPAGTPTAIVIRSPGKVVGTPPIFGDGVLCVSAANLVRLAATTASGGSSVHAFGHGAMAGPGDFHYQAWYRNTPASFCTPEPFNLSSGITLTWP